MNIMAAILVPAIVAGITWVISWRMWRRRSLAPRGHWGGTVGIALGFVSANVVLVSWPPFPPNTAAQWLVYLAVAASALMLYEGKSRRNPSWLWRFRFTLSAAFMLILLRSMIMYTWTDPQALFWIAAIIPTTAAVWKYLDDLAKRRTGAALPISLWLVCAVAGFCLLVSGSALLGQLAGALAATFGAAIVLGLWARGFTLSGGGISIFTLLYAGLLWQGCFYSELPIASGVLLFVAPLAAWVGEMQSIARLSPKKTALARLTATAVPLAIAVALSVWAAGGVQTELYDY